MCFFIRLFNKQQLEVKSFKKRRRLQTYFYKKNTFNKSFINFVTKKEMTFEIIYFNFLKKIIKKLSKQTKINFFFKKKNVWVFWKPNYPLTKKSKNSRMGKGKGMFLRWTFRVGSYFCIFRIKNYSSKIRLVGAKKSLNFKLINNFFFN